jgi:hypothetical protein
MARRSLLYVPLVHRSFSQRFRLARLTRRGVAGDFAKRILFDGDDMVVLPRDGATRSRTIAMDVVAAPESVPLPSSVAEHFVRKAERRFLMRSCICRDSIRNDINSC